MAAAAALCGSAVLAQLAGSTPDLSWNTVDNGGGKMIAETITATIELIGTIGQPDANPQGALHGGGYALAPGFWHDFRGVPSDCLGDVAPPPAGNGFVDVDDLILVILTWGQVNGAGDANGSGMVDVDDLITVILHWGTCPA